jgi:hypothetical protein
MATANDAVFMHPAFSWVKTEIERRETIYGSRVRAGNLSAKDHETFLAGKTAWGTIRNGANELLLGKAQKGFGSLYSGTEATDGGNIIPKPTLSSISVRHDGEYGTLQRATVTFKVYSIKQLEDIECSILVVGQDVKINYGWSVDNNTNAHKKGEDPNQGEFNGITYNFSYNLNKEGGFDCSFDAVGEGYFTLGTNPHLVGSDTLVEKKSKDGVSEKTFTGFGNIADNIKTKLEKDDAFKTHGASGEGLSVFQLNLKAIELAEGEEKSEDGGDRLQWYISLDKLVELINSELKKQTSYRTSFVCDPDTTLGHKDPWIKSPAIQHIIFPGLRQGDYTFKEINKLANNPNPGVDVQPLIDAFNAENKDGIKPATDPNILQFNNNITGKTGDGFGFNYPGIKDDEIYLGGTLININTLQSIQNSLTSKRNDVATIKGLLTGIFNLISECSGGVYDLTIVPTENETTTNNLIVNKNHTKFTHSSLEKQIVSFKPFGTQSVVRDMSLSAQIPDALATQAYVATRGAKSGAQSTSYPKPVTGLFTNKCGANNNIVIDSSGNETSQNPNATTPTPITPGGVTPQSVEQKAAAGKRDAANAVKAQKLQNHLQVLFGYYKYTRIELDYDEVFVHKLLGEQESIASALNTYKTLGDNDLDKWNQNILLPLKFGVTIDGINGFKFGDTVATTYLPKKYKEKISGKFKAVFTVTKVNHSIQNNDWTTTLETVCRLSV